LHNYKVNADQKCNITFFRDLTDGTQDLVWLVQKFFLLIKIYVERDCCRNLCLAVITNSHVLLVWLADCFLSDKLLLHLHHLTLLTGHEVVLVAASHDAAGGGWSEDEAGVTDISIIVGQWIVIAGILRLQAWEVGTDLQLVLLDLHVIILAATLSDAT
jgi:hypothetical protein